MTNIMDELRGKLTVTKDDRARLAASDLAALERLVIRVNGKGFPSTKIFNDDYYSAEHLELLQSDIPELPGVPQGTEFEDAGPADELKGYAGAPAAGSSPPERDPELDHILARGLRVVQGIMKMPVYEGYCFCAAGTGPLGGPLKPDFISKLYVPGEEWCDRGILNASLRVPTAAATEKQIIVVIAAYRHGHATFPIAPNDVLFVPCARFRVVKLFEYRPGKFMLFLRETVVKVKEEDLVEEVEAASMKKPLSITKVRKDKCREHKEKEKAQRGAGLMEWLRSWWKAEV